MAIVTIAAAGPACLKACELAKRADMAMAVSFTIVLQLINIIAAPLWAKVIVTGAEVDPWSIVVDLLLLVLLPLTVGQILRGRYPEHRDGWKAGLERVSDIALYLAIGFGLAANWKAVITILGSWVILASVVIIPFAVAAELRRYLTRGNRKPALAAAPASAPAGARSATAAPSQAT